MYKTKTTKESCFVLGGNDVDDGENSSGMLYATTMLLLANYFIIKFLTTQ